MSIAILFYPSVRGLFHISIQGFFHVSIRSFFHMTIQGGTIENWERAGRTIDDMSDRPSKVLAKRLTSFFGG
jgi:hypothetical protein